MKSIILTWHFAPIIPLLFLLCMPTNLALELDTSNIKCIEKERQALLSFKQEVVDTDGILSSWKTTQVNNDCCSWRGIQCNNNTGRIVRLDLRGSDDKYLKGNVGSSLAQLSHLNYLDLSHNWFDQISLKDIASLINLNYLNLSYNLLDGVIPPHLGNLSKLTVLDLRSNEGLFIKGHDNLRWLLSISSLKHLDLSWVDFNSTDDWVSAINNLTLLQTLSLRSCFLSQPILSSRANFSRFLVELDLSENYLNSSIYSWLKSFSNNLIHLDLAYNNLQGLNLDDFGNMTSLVFLNLRSTKVDLLSTPSFNLCNLKSLFLSENNGKGLLSDFLKNFPPCLLNSLEYLGLASNKFFGSFPNFTIFPSLKGLDLINNVLNGTIHQSLGQLSNLEHLHLCRNSLKGEISESHFSKLTKLKHLGLSRNSLSINVKLDWVPPFQLESILLRSCKLGPLFPKWLRTQNFSTLDISNNEISDIIPNWFWNNLSPELKFMDLSGNKIKGEIPNLSVKLETTPWIILQSNEFVGKIPAFLLQGEALDLSNNQFSDFTCLCEIANSPLSLLDLSNNHLSGYLPNCWDHMGKLNSLSLANNTFSGDIPNSMGNFSGLKYLILRNNQFSGDFPYWFNFTDLKVFDAMNNNLSGIVPWWIGSKLPNLIRLNLKSNHFHGSLPSSLCDLKNIQVLDISFNNVSGNIPTCIHNFSAMTRTSNSSGIYDWGDVKFGFQLATLSYFSFFKVAHYQDLVMMWKGQEKFIQGDVLLLQRSIDLSCNHLTGKIPDEITELVGLITLNLSKNELTGHIPEKMGQLHSLESLDLSKNHLCGPIPSSFSQISRLSMLNLSYNNLSEKIPTGTQLQGFSASSYEGNPYLCGDPLKKCFEEITQEPSINHENGNEGKIVMREFLISMYFGFFVGFWGIFGSLIRYRKWRHTYFKFLTDIIDKASRSN